MNLYTPTRSTRAATPAPEIFVPQQYKRETSILSTDSRFDPNDHFHDPLLDPRYLAFLFRTVYERVWNPTPNFPSCIVVKSGSTPVRGPVKSGRKRTEDKGRGLDKRLVRPELVTAWIQ